MAASARIDELRNKFEHDARRFFAPLANEYRKAGDLSTAIAICRTQLRQFPSHMSGHVVLGQALFEAGELAEAREVFRRAVELDPENLIALRHLGDIARDLGDRSDAHEWYRRVLDTDPYNEQIAALVAETAGPAPVVPEPVDAPLPPELEVAPPAELPPEPPEREVAPQIEVASIESESFEFVDDWALPELAAEPAVGLDLPPVEDAALPELEAIEAPEPEPEPARPEWPEEEGASLDLVTSGTFATETMAELCLEQGHDHEALAIFEQLLAQRPGDAALRERVRALRERLEPAPPHDEPSAGDFLRSLATRVPTAAEAAPAEPTATPTPTEDRDAWAAAAWSDAFRDLPPREPDLTFDRFFAGQTLLDETPAPEPMIEEHAASDKASEPVDVGVVESDDDLEDFNAWLRGLRDS